MPRHKHPSPIRPALWGAMLALLAAGPALGAPGERECERCHYDQALVYAESAHALARKRGSREAPDCIACHDTHPVPVREESLRDMKRPKAPETCARCHGDARLMTQVNLSTHLVETFEESFHGRALALGSMKTAVCTSCHGVHAIRAPEDPKSRVHPSRLVFTCGQAGCHRNVTLKFVLGFSHRPPTRALRPAAFWIQTIYTWGIRLSIAVMALYLILDLARGLVRRRRGEVRA